MDTRLFYFDEGQVDSILERLVPLIAEPEDHAFFRAVLRIKAETCNAATFAAFCHQLLHGTSGSNDDTPREASHGVG